jgi:hypothetical protein
MNKSLLVYTGLLSLFTIYTIHKYEASIKQYKDSIEDYKRALNIAKNNDVARHYTWLQLENKNLNQDNDALQAKINGMQEELGYLRNVKGEAGIQYESSTYNSNKWDPSKYEISIEL